jgi:hypothetical protein
MVGLRWAPRAAATTAPDGTPAYLLRSSYSNLSTPTFTTSFATLQLQSAGDLTIAATDKSFVNSEDAFALEFTCDSPLSSGIQTLSHPDLGVFDLGIGPAAGAYEAVINRSVNAPKHGPPLPPPPAKPTSHTGAAAAPPKQPAAHHARPPHVKRLSARRLGRSAVAEIAFSNGADVKSVVVWLSRKGLVVATGEQGHLHASRLAVRLPTLKRPPGGHYDLTVQTKDRHGHSEFKRVKIALQ